MPRIEIRNNFTAIQTQDTLGRTPDRTQKLRSWPSSEAYNPNRIGRDCIGNLSQVRDAGEIVHVRKELVRNLLPAKII
jgi:hypothetical protein